MTSPVTENSRVQIPDFQGPQVQTNLPESSYVPRNPIIRFFLFGICLSLILVFFPFLHSLEAQVTCSGAACSLLPSSIQQQLNQADQALESQYVTKVLESMTEAAVLSNINSAMMGPGTVNRFQIGGSFSTAFQQKDNIDVVFRDLNFRGLPNVGAAVTPNLNAAFNLGWLLGHGPSDTVTDYAHFLHRFNIYLHGFQYNFAQSDIQELVRRQDDKLELNGNISNYGVTVRFHLYPVYSDGIGFFEFSGISLGMGLHYQKQELSLVYNDTATQAITLGSAIGTWGGSTAFDYSSTVTSLPMDIRTGFRTFYFLTVFFGAGTSMNFGTSKIDLQRQGPLSLSLNNNLLSNQEVGSLGIRLDAKGNAPNTISYLIGGVELNFLFAKLLVEGMVSKNIQSVNIGAKIAF
jgi:hypothetical protein